MVFRWVREWSACICKVTRVAMISRILMSIWSGIYCCLPQYLSGFIKSNFGMTDNDASIMESVKSWTRCRQKLASSGSYLEQLWKKKGEDYDWLHFLPLYRIQKGSVIRETSQQCIHSSVMVGKGKPSKAWAPEVRNGVLHTASWGSHVLLGTSIFP